MGKNITAVRPPQAVRGKSFNEFVEHNDRNVMIPKRLTTALKQMGNSWEDEREFLKLAGVSNTDITRFRDQFQEYIVVYRSAETGNVRRAWAGTKELAKKMRERVA